MERECPDEGKEVDGSFFAVPEPSDNDHVLLFICSVSNEEEGAEGIVFLFSYYFFLKFLLNGGQRNVNKW